MKYKVTNVCDRGITETFPGVFRFILQPEESLIIEDVTVKGIDGKPDELYCAGEIVRMIKQSRGIRGTADLKFEPFLEDREVAKILVDSKDRIVFENKTVEDKPVPTVFTTKLNKEK